MRTSITDFGKATTLPTSIALSALQRRQCDLAHLQAIEAWLRKEQTVLRAYIAGISASLFVQRATAVLGADILALPYPEDQDLDLSDNERVVAQDIVEFQREFIRRGTGSSLMQTCA